MCTMCYNYLISCTDAMAKINTTISPGKNLAHLGSNSKRMNVRCQSLGSTVKCTVIRRIALLLPYIARASIVESFQLRNENVFCFVFHSIILFFNAVLTEARLTCIVVPLTKFLTFHLFLHSTLMQLFTASVFTFPNFT